MEGRKEKRGRGEGERERGRKEPIGKTSHSFYQILISIGFPNRLRITISYRVIEGMIYLQKELETQRD